MGLNDAVNNAAALADFNVNNDAMRYMQCFAEASMQQQYQQQQAVNNIVAEQMQQQIQQANGIVPGIFSDPQQQQPFIGYPGAGPTFVGGGYPVTLTPQNNILMPPTPLPAGIPLSPFFPLPSPFGGGPAPFIFPVSPFVLISPSANGAGPAHCTFFSAASNSDPFARPSAPLPPSSPMVQFPPPQNVPWTPSA